MEKPETKFKKKVYSLLDEIPGLWYEKIQQLAIRGTPDLLICYRGKFLAWELKVGDNEADALQAYTLGRIKEAGGIGRIVTPSNLSKCIKELRCLSL